MKNKTFIKSEISTQVSIEFLNYHQKDNEEEQAIASHLDNRIFATNCEGNMSLGYSAFTV